MDNRWNVRMLERLKVFSNGERVSSCSSEKFENNINIYPCNRKIAREIGMNSRAVAGVL